MDFFYQVFSNDIEYTEKGNNLIFMLNMPNLYNNNMKRTNGFMFPLSIQQVIAWVSILGQIILNETALITVLISRIRVKFI